MTKFLSIFLIAAAVLIGGGCDRNKPAAPTVVKKPAPKTAWTPEEIVADPEGYLKWSDGQVAAQIAKREEDRRLLAERRKVIEAKQQVLLDNINDVSNINKRLQQAYEKAEDEDRWPIRIGEFTFDRDKAKAVIAQTAQYVKDREPLKGTYSDIFSKMSAMDSTYAADIDKLNKLRDKLAIDLESVKLNKGMAEVEKLRQTETQLSSMATAAAATHDDPLKLTAPEPPPPGKVNIAEMLK